MMASGVRSSCAMSAVKSRWARKPASRRSSAWLTAWTSGTTSVGIDCSGRRTSVRAGPIAAAVVEASRTGSSARRKIRMSISSSSSRIGKVIHATRGKNEVTTSSMMTSRWDRSWPTWIQYRRSPTGRATLTPNSTEPVLRRRMNQSPTSGSSGANSAAPSSARGEEDAARGVEHGIGVEPVAARIERLDLGRNVERHAAVGLRPQEAGDGRRLAAQRVAVQAVGGLVEQPVERQRHQDRGHADRDDVQRHDARDDRAEAPHPLFSSAIR